MVSAGLPILKDNQARASDPASHVWLSASAGTGKTQVLAARVFRLLLRGVDPAAILCLTFTKAGAAEMAGRISQRLAAWVRMDAAALKKDLFALGEDHLDPARLAFARTLFAKLLDAPGGGVRIQTIHGFCQGLLAAFPIEAGLVPGFRPLEAREEAVLARDTLAAMLVDAEAHGRGTVVEAVGALSRRLGEGEAERFLHECARSLTALQALPFDIAAFVRGALQLPAGPIEDEIARCCADDEFDVDGVARIAAANRGWGTATGGNHADIAECWIDATPAMRATMLGDLVAVPFTAQGGPRKYAPKLILAEPDYVELAVALGGRCAELLSMRARAEYADLLAAALEVGRDYARAYALAKRRIGGVDFDDLIRATVDLLDQPGMGEWVRYKLDQATEHILIDEAQDTNLAQWKIIDKLAEEFFAGQGAHGERTRTLFTVGDYKQAIFGFQGTDPMNFRWAEARFSGKAGVGPEAEAGPGAGDGAPFTRLSLTQSFRSTRPVLEFVDAAIEALGEPGLGAVVERERHASEVPGPGTVTLWPPVILRGSEEDPEGWIPDATRALAAKVARAVKSWLDGGLMLESQARPLQPEDVMILVKRRGELASLIVARLYAEGVAVAGVDRLRLNAPLAVQDLLAAVRFVLQPGDDLALASLLVSPLIGWSQDALMEAAPRGSGSLWAHLQRTQAPERLAPLRAMLARADIATPYRFLEELLSGPLGGRRKLLRRLGQEARDPIDELLNAALAFEGGTSPSLQRFLDWFDRGEVDIKRDPSEAQDAVRVMTAHGAKGLQAPLVILADATVDPARTPTRLLKWAAHGDNKLPIFRPRARERGGQLAQLVAAAEQRELEEHWRLFYVAATRAEERLVIAGALGAQARGEPPGNSWYAAAGRALDALGVAPSADERVFRGIVPAQAVKPRDRRASPPPPTPDLPEWTSRAAPIEARPPRPLAPSSLGGDDVADPPPSPALRAAAERGRLMHALFERLPATSPSARAAAADRWLETAGGVSDAAARREIASAVLAVIDDPALADVFGPEALAEAPIAAVVGGGVVAGTVDRLVITDRLVHIVDFKTGRHAPVTVADIPVYHLRQMAAYSAAIRAIFPDREVAATLLYTAGPISFALPPALLDQHKPGFAGPEQS